MAADACLFYSVFMEARESPECARDNSLYSVKRASISK